jgi:hypothetical protein
MVITNPQAGNWTIRVRFTSSPGFGNIFIYAEQDYAVVADVVYKTPQLSISVPQATINVLPGATFTLQPTIQNTGGYIAAGVTVQVNPQSGSFGGFVNKSRYVGNLLYQGASASPAISITAPSQVGQYSLIVKADGVNKGLNSPQTTVTVNVCTPQTYYRDADGDGYGNPSVTTQACSAPAGYVSNSSDCNDSNAAVHPGATEVCNGIDDNCNGQIDEGVKNTYYRDADGDGYGNPNVTTQACSAPAGYVSNSSDCDDSNAAVHPGATEVCNGIDDNCNGQVDEGCTGPTRIIGVNGDLAFGNVQVNTTAQRIMTITNSGNSVLTVSGINYSTNVFSGAWSGSITAGGAQAVTVTFAPTAATTYSGTVTVNSDATSGNNTISASGTGTTAPTEFQQWQMLYFSCTNCPQAAAAADPDGDGMSNTNEFLAGTVPTNSAIVFRVIAMEKLGGDIRVSFTSVTGKYYCLERCDFIGGAWTTIVDNIPGNNGNQQAIDIGGASRSCAFYRVRLNQSPNPALADSDGDGIPDSWMQLYFGHPTGLASDHSCAVDDPDGDGKYNLQEYLTGTNPTNSASAFRVVAVAREGSNIRVTWTTGGGRTNAVQAASDLSGSYSNVSPNIVVQGSGDTTTNYVDVGGATNAPARYYRIRLVP